MHMNVSLTDDLADLVSRKVATGRYGSSSEVVSQALRLLAKTEEQEAENLGFLRAAWRDGVESGDAGELDFQALKEEARARFAASKA